MLMFLQMTRTGWLCPMLLVYEQNYAVKGRSIQENLHLVHEILEGLEDGIKAALINLDQSKAMYKFDHRFLVTVLETAGFQPKFRKWISMMYHNLQTVVLMNRKRSEVFAIERSVRQDCPQFPLFYVVALGPLVRRIRDEKESQALRGIPFAVPLSAMVSVYADDIMVFVPRLLDIKAIQKARYNKSKGLWVDAWRGGVPLPGPFRWSDGFIRILGVCFGPGFQLEQNWAEALTKINAQVGT